MLHRLILKVTKFQLPPPRRLSTVVKNILGGHHVPMSNKVKDANLENKHNLLVYLHVVADHVNKSDRSVAHLCVT